MAMFHDALKTRPQRLLAAAALALIALSFAFRGHLVFTRYFDPDEMEHLHAAMCVFRGMLPARDFFQHHPPLYYFLLAPIFFLGASLRLLFVGRTLSQLVTALIILSTYRLGRRAFGRDAGLLAAVWLSWHFVFLWRSLEIRPDVPAAFLLLEGIIRLWDGWRTSDWRSWFLAGLAFGGAFLFTPKVVYALAGTAAAFGLGSLLGNSGEKFSARIKGVIPLAVAFVLPIAACALYYFYRGALAELVRTNIIMPLNWRRKIWPWHLRTVIFYNPIFAVSAAAGLVFCRKQGVRLIPVLTALTAIGGSWLVPIAQAQYYLLFLPLTAIFAAWAFLVFFNWVTTDGSGRLSLAYIGFLSAGVGLPLALKYLWDYEYGLNLGNFWVGLGLTVALAAAAFFCVSRRKEKIRAAGTALLILSAMIRPAWVFAHYHLSHNREQLKAIGHLLLITSPEDRVMDGWSGLSVFRPHAYYYYFLHEGVLMMLTEEEKGPKLLAALKENPPRIIINDVYLNHVGAEVRDFIAHNYRPHVPGHPYLEFVGTSKTFPKE